MARPDIFRVATGFEDEWDGAVASATEVVINVIRVGDLFNRRVDALARAHGLPSSVSIIALEVLRGAGAPLQPSVIAERSFVSRPALTGLLDSLERRGLVRRTAHPGTRRGVLVSITPEGLRRLEGLLPDLHRAEASWTAALPGPQRAELLRHLGRLHHGLVTAE